MMKTNLSKSVVLAIFLAFGFTTLRAASDKTVKDLQAAFTGESTASAKYTAFAKKAREEGNPKVAVLFDAASKAESIHAGNHKAVLQQLVRFSVGAVFAVGSTRPPASVINDEMISNKFTTSVPT